MSLSEKKNYFNRICYLELTAIYKLLFQWVSMFLVDIFLNFKYFGKLSNNGIKQ